MLILVSIITILLSIFFYYNKTNYFKKHGIPYLEPMPIFGNMASPLFQLTSLADQLKQIYYINENAKYIGLYDFSTPVIMIRDPELMRSIATKHFDHFVDHRGFVDPIQDPLFGGNIFSLRGDNWREVRNLLSPSFTSSKMKGMFKLMLKCSENFVDFLTEQSIKQQSINSKDAFTRYTNDVIATCAFGVTVDSMRNPNNEFYVLGKKATNFEGILSIKFFLLRNFPMISKLLRVKLIGSYVEDFFYEIVRDTIAMRDEKGISRPDMIQLMMETRHNKDGNGRVLSIEDMTSQAFIFFFGGFDTSSSLMCFLAHEISINNDIQKRLQNEIDELYGKCNGEPSYEAINDLQYLEAVINEALRMYPIATFLDRICTKSFVLPPTLPGVKPLQLNYGDNLWFPAYAVHRDPKYFNEPDKFLPERFIGDKIAINSPAYVPFGNGPRMCIGNRFALLETKVLFFHLIAKCQITPSKKMILPLEFSNRSFTITAKGGFWLDLKPRNKW